MSGYTILMLLSMLAACLNASFEFNKGHYMGALGWVVLAMLFLGLSTGG